MTEPMSIQRRNNVTVQGEGTHTFLAHGFGCDQSMWRPVVPVFAATGRVVLFDEWGWRL